MNANISRKAYLIGQKEAGRSLFGVFPALYPREILYAFNAVPAEIWDPPVEMSEANAHLQPYICSVVKAGLELILQGHCDMLDGFIFPHTCDSIQNLASMIHDSLEIHRPCCFFYHPKAPYRKSSRQYYIEQLKALIAALESILGPMDPSRLRESVQQGHELTAVLHDLYEKRRCGTLNASAAEFYRVLRKGEYLHPDDFIPHIEALMAGADQQEGSGPSVLLSGILPNPPEVLTLLDELGIRVVDDDLLNAARRIPVSQAPAQDPFECLTEAYFSLPPCPTKNSAIEARIQHLIQKIEKSGARGVIFYMVKFCEPELFDLPLISAALKRRGIPTLVLDVEVNQGLTGQLTTRVEAFSEMIR